MYYIKHGEHYTFGVCERIYRSRRMDWPVCDYFIDRAEEQEQKDADAE